MTPVVPWGPLSGPAADLVAQVWTTAMLGLWGAGVWTLRVVLVFEDSLLTPDLSEAGPASAAYRVTFWLAGTLAVVMLLVQIGLVLLRRDARSLGAALWGCGKFVVVWAAWLAYGAAVVSACGGLTRALLWELLHVKRWSDWQPSLHLRPETVVDATVATVLGLLGLVLWLAALGHVLVMVTRAATLLVLAAVTPVAAAGLVGEAGRSWFWKSVRWFHAAALTPVLVALLIGVGVQTTTGVASGLAVGPARAVGTALPGVLLVVVSCFAPMALFRLLAFVDPATPAGVQVRQAVNSVLQVQSLLAQHGSALRRDPSATGSASTDVAPADRRRAEAQYQLDTEAGQDDDAPVGAGPSAIGPAGSPAKVGAADAAGTDSPPRATSDSTSSSTAPSSSRSWRTALPSSAPSGIGPSSPAPSSPAPSSTALPGPASSGPASSGSAPAAAAPSVAAPDTVPAVLAPVGGEAASGDGLGALSGGDAASGVWGGSVGGSVAAETAAIPVLPV